MSKGEKKKNKDTLVKRIIHGRLLSLDFFSKNWLKILVIIIMILICITNKYQCQTRMETIKKLEQQLEIVKTERIREKSKYMGRIRESSMQELIDTLNLNLQIQESPPFKITYVE